jgi:hypothetical protein
LKYIDISGCGIEDLLRENYYDPLGHGQDQSYMEGGDEHYIHSNGYRSSQSVTQDGVAFTRNGDGTTIISWHTWNNTHEIHNGEVVIISEKVEHSRVLPSPYTGRNSAGDKELLAPLSGQSAPGRGSGYSLSMSFALHYLNGNGTTIHLSNADYQYMYNIVRDNNLFEWRTIRPVDNNEYSITANFYGSTFDLENAFGRATFYLQWDKTSSLFRPTGFYDTWNLDAKVPNVRPSSAESKTRFFNKTLNGTPFKITYP